jgi:hypothetical protein
MKIEITKEFLEKFIKEYIQTQEVCIYEGNDFIPSYNGTILELFFGDKADQFKEKVEDCCQQSLKEELQNNKVYKDYEDYLNKSVEKILKELSLDI